MNKHTFFSFFAGIIIGGLGVWLGMNEYYSERERKAVESVKEKYKADTETAVEPNDKKEDDIPFTSPIEFSEYSDIAKQYANRDLEEKSIEESEPFVIKPEEFGELGYTMESLIYFSDNVLTDDDYVVLENISGTVGFDSLKHFGEYEEDCVHVRNPRLKIDYEILMDNRKFRDVTHDIPHLRGDDYD